MAETIEGEVIHVVGPEELDDHDLTAELRSLAASRYVIVCRKGGAPNLFERVWAFLRRDPIQPVTIVAERAVNEGTELTATVRETEIPGVYEATEIR
jgi:hypothetical protein